MSSLILSEEQVARPVTALQYAGMLHNVTMPLGRCEVSMSE